MTQINEDGVTVEELKTAKRVLKKVEDHFKDNLNKDHATKSHIGIVMIEKYDNDSEWREPRAVDDIDPSDHQTLDTFEAQQ